MSVLAMQMQELDNNIVPSFDKVYTRIKGQISRMTSLMDDVLILGKINAGSIRPLFESVDAVALCREMVNNYNEIDENGQCVEFKYIGSPKSVNLDPKLLEHIISNLVSNALKYSEGRPSPSVVLDFIDSKVEIIVADHGMGIPTADVNHLFEPFYRASNVENVSGTGLGSTIAKEYTELMNGTISVKSKINEGSQFIVEFNTSENGKCISS
jgi:signal transduction histidine kinase